MQHCVGNILLELVNVRDEKGEAAERSSANRPARKIVRSIHEGARDIARGMAKTAAHEQSPKDRKKVEMLFAHLKRIFKLDRLRLRGMNGARDEFLLAATAQNLRRMAKLLSQPPPTEGGNRACFRPNHSD